MRELTFGMNLSADGYIAVTHPVLVGGGTPFFTALGQQGEPDPLETRSFPTAWS